MNRCGLRGQGGGMLHAARANVARSRRAEGLGLHEALEKFSGLLMNFLRILMTRLYTSVCHVVKIFRSVISAISTSQ